MNFQKSNKYTKMWIENLGKIMVKRVRKVIM
jgi:hypothetical protein